MSKTILIVEDQQVLREIMKEYLTDEGYLILEAGDGKQALALFQEHEVDLVVLDIMLPEVDGWSVCRRIRKTSSVPVLMLTSRSDEDDTLLGFELGADDYVVKPCSPPILLARVKRLLEGQQRRPSGGTLSGGAVTLHVPSRSVSVNGTPCNLTHTEFEILACLLSSKGIIFTREQLITKIWGYEFAGDDRTLSSHIRNLRSKLGEHAGHIVTVIRSGYKFEDNP
ncbi:response regulator transcription factor [Paenibacillus sp. MMS20-IR301]|uniref:response regulator transcription factor n=1 Tax=Paenibacillus sp. MMS20-IR301 TaxID=2895946 RepID=UPI0028E52014|nr:response regulator transcription factor [Paenibacillus sp. MMS20-IR301]WNS43086.1 response regulator transcription factor [Paenibacillus sp. MMS20-IR301]